MKIAIDCRKIHDGGIGTYLRNLLVNWREQQVPASFFLFHLSKDSDYFRKFGNIAEPIPHDISKYSISELFSFSGPLKKIGATLFFTPHYTLPYRLPCPAVTTIHDLIHLKFRNKGGFVGKAYAKQLISHACRVSGAILTDSENTSRDIAATFPGWAHKIRVVYPGVDLRVFKPRSSIEVEAFKKEKLLPEKFVLYVGALKPHKNPGALVEIVNKLKVPVVIATQDLQIYQNNILNKIENQKLVQMIIVKDDREMALLYNAATLLVHPAFYEGFGLPPLEAMGSGLPVVCSNAASLPEVVGNAALLFDPNDPSGMIENVNLLWRDTALQDILKAKGAEKARTFSWEKAASRVFEIFCEVSRS